jgi:hypothetical protein
MRISQARAIAIIAECKAKMPPITQGWANYIESVCLPDEYKALTGMIHAKQCSYAQMLDAISRNYKSPSFRSKDGRLTAYSFACGYIERKSTEESVDTDLWHEHACFHVRQHDFGNGKRVFWESFPTLKEARKLFDAQPGEFVKG